MSMTLEEACEYVFNGWAPRVESYEIKGNTVHLKCKSAKGREIYDGEVEIINGGERFTYWDAYKSNTSWIFGNNVCQMMTEGKITH